MSVDSEAVIQTEMELNRAREAAALREYSTWIKLLHIVRVVGWISALVPIVGIFGVGFLAGMVPFFGFALIGVMGAKKYAIKQVLITIGAAFVAIVTWFVWNLIVLAAFA